MLFLLSPDWSGWSDVYVDCGIQILNSLNLSLTAFTTHVPCFLTLPTFPLLTV